MESDLLFLVVPVRERRLISQQDVATRSPDGGDMFSSPPSGCFLEYPPRMWNKALKYAGADVEMEV